MPVKKRPRRVIVFTTPTCRYCRQAKQYLQKHNIPFKDVDITRDPAAAREIVRKTGQMGVPVVNIDGRYIVGFDKPRIDALLGVS